MPLRNFRDWALEQVRRLIAFDSPWWGNAAVEPMKIHWLHLHNCYKSILKAYPPYIADDFFRAALMASPGTSINMSDRTTRARFIRTALYRDVGKRYRIQWSLGTLQIDPVSSLSEFLTLWRHDPEETVQQSQTPDQRVADAAPDGGLSARQPAARGTGALCGRRPGVQGKSACHRDQADRQPALSRGQGQRPAGQTDRPRKRNCRALCQR